MKDVYAINRIHFAKRVESDNVSPALFFFLTLRRRTNKVEVIPAVVDRGELEVRGVDEQQQVSKCKGLPSKKQNLVSSKESTPAKDTGTTVTRPQSQFNSEQSIELDNVSPPRISFFALMGRGNTVDVIPVGWMEVRLR